MDQYNKKDLIAAGIKFCPTTQDSCCTEAAPNLIYVN